MARTTTQRALRVPRAPEHLLLGLVLLALVLRFATLGVQSLDADEAVTADTVHRSLSSAMAQVPANESTPPLYFFLAWLWTKLFSTSEWGLRSLSAVAGTLVVPVVYAVGSELGARRAGLTAAALAAVSPLLVWYSQEARPYALYLLLASLSFLFFLRARRNGRALWWWALASVAALATHYFAAVLVAPEAIWLLFVHRRRALAAVGALALATLPLVLLVAHQNASTTRDWEHGLSFSDNVLATSQSFLVGLTWTWLIHRPGVIVLALLVLAMAWRARHRREAIVPAAIAAVALLVPLAVAAVGPKYLTPGNVLCVWVLLAIVAGMGATTWLAAAACGVMLAITLAAPLTPALQRENWRDLIRPIHGPRAVVVLSWIGQYPVRYYLRHEGPPRPVRDATIVVNARDTRGVPNPTLAGMQPVGTIRKAQLQATNLRAPLPTLLPAPPYPGTDSHAIYSR